jgi:hypothetical protein
MMGVLVIGSVVGCNGSDPQASPPPQQAAAPKPAPEAPPSAADPAPPPAKAPDAPKPVEWVLDPAQHDIPAAPVAGRVGGKPFMPEVVVQGDRLTFRALEDSGVSREVVLELTPGQLKAGRVVVKPEQTAGADVPSVATVLPKDGKPEFVVFGNGYGLTLELGKREKGKLPGRVYLALPGDDKTFFAGTFSADRQRGLTDTPDADDAPFVQGKVTAAGGAAEPVVRVGYVGAPADGDPVADFAEMPLAGQLGMVRSETYKPRVTAILGVDGAKGAGRYEHTRLAPGRYLVFAKAADGPAAWKWLTVTPDGQLSADFSLGAAKPGALDVKLPADVKEPVRLAPADPDGPTAEAAFLSAALALGLQAEAKDGKASFAKLGPGGYTVKAGDLTATAEVKAGETATVELKPAKK